MSNKRLIIIICFLVHYLLGSTFCLQIPRNLINCYRGNGTKPWMGNTFQHLLELIRKIEDANPTSLDIRRLSVNLLHKIRLDGIVRAPRIRESEFITPYRANGIMTPKFQVLLQLISDTPGSIEFEEFLTPDELCHLHRLISSSVEPFERGDESKVCPMTLLTVDGNYQRNRVQDSLNGTFTTDTENLSRCPLEMGVVRTLDYGSFSPGTVIASIAAGLQPQNIQINELIAMQQNIDTITDSDSKASLDQLLNSMDSIDNTYSASLAGDLAEVCAYQGPYLEKNLIVGLPGTWNDTILPRVRFISPEHKARWEMTDSEILAGIDGIFISQQIGSWVHRIRRIRLSQVLDMFYNARGIPTLAIENANRALASASKKHSVDGKRKKEQMEIFEKIQMNQHPTMSNQLELIRNTKFAQFSASDDISSACNRKNILKVIDREKLKDETYFLSQILQFTTSSLPVTDTLLRVNCDAAVDKFFEYAEKLLDLNPPCNEIPADYRRPTVDLKLIIGGSREKYEQLQLISYIAESIDISSYGSLMTVYHGSTGARLVNRTRSISSTLQQLQNFTDSFPQSLSLSTCLQALIVDLNNQTYTDRLDGILVSTAPVILIFSQFKRINQADFESAKRIIQGSLSSFPDLYFVAVTDDTNTFNELFGSSHLENYPKKYKIIESKTTNFESFSQELTDHLKSIPKHIIQPFCEHKSSKWRLENSISGSEFFEDYASPNQEIRYKISAYYIVNSEEVKVQFLGVSYGVLTVCLARESTFTQQMCQTVRDYEAVWFNITKPCDNYSNCPEVYFSVLLDRSNVRCTENDCRYPDQVRFIIKHEGLRCESDWNATANLNVNLGFICVLVLIHVLITFY